MHPTNNEWQPIGFGAAPHFVIREKMHFDPELGGWAMRKAHDSTHRAQQPPSHPPHWAPPDNAGLPRNRDKNSRDIEKFHYGDFRLDMKEEEKLGLMPPAWSTTSSMSDIRPNGRAQFDARFIENAPGRARGGRSMMWQPVGTVDGGETKKAKHKGARAIAAAVDKFQDDTGTQLDTKKYVMLDGGARAREAEASMGAHDSFVDGQAGPAKTHIYGLRDESWQGKNWQEVSGTAIKEVTHNDSWHKGQGGALNPGDAPKHFDTTPNW